MDQLQLIDAALSVNRNLLQNGLFLYLWEQKEKERRRSQRKRRFVWVRHWLVRRSEFGIYEQLMKELREEDITGFKNFLRVDPAMFQEIVDRLTPRIQKNTWFRMASKEWNRG